MIFVTSLMNTQSNAKSRSKKKKKKKAKDLFPKPHLFLIAFLSNNMRYIIDPPSNTLNQNGTSPSNNGSKNLFDLLSEWPFKLGLYSVAEKASFFLKRKKE